MIAPNIPTWNLVWQKYVGTGIAPMGTFNFTDSLPSLNSNGMGFSLPIHNEAGMDTNILKTTRSHQQGRVSENDTTVTKTYRFGNFRFSNKSNSRFTNKSTLRTLSGMRQYVTFYILSRVGLYRTSIEWCE